MQADSPRMDWTGYARRQKPSIRKYRELFRPNVWNFEEEHGGADISP